MHIKNLELESFTMASGEDQTARVVLNEVVTGPPVTVLLDSSDERITVPALVSIAEGETSAEFTIEADDLPDGVPFSVSAHYWAQTFTARLVTSAFALKSITVSPITAVGGTAITIEVKLSGLAPEGGAEVELSQTVKEGGAAVITNLPPFLVVPEGEDTNDVIVQTRKVNKPTVTNIKGTYIGLSATTSLTLTS